MTTITKEWLQQTIAEFENTRDDIPFGLSDNDAKVIIVLKRALASLTAEPVRYLNKFSGTCVTLEQQPNASDDVAVYMPLYAAPPASERERIRREHAEWSDKTFGDVGPVGPLKHLSKEALETAAEPDDLSEWADMQFLLWDAQRRAGISDEQITLAMVEKLAVNKKREWPEPKDGEPRLHIKEQPESVVPEECPAELPYAQVKEVADLFALCWQSGEVVTYTPDPEKAIIWLNNYSGTCVQEYVKLERLQEALAGNSPVILEGWISCSERMPEDEQEVIVHNKLGYRYVSYFDEHSGLFFDMRGGNQMNCIEHILVTHWMPLPAAPQQEVK
ncbi:DUF550 domain-containing protein [Salmonella enterica subsp. enterica]|nr:dATP/dGTP pyrophosphohydrolase domain-containing protein [Salmonella enterica]EBY6161310.1 DUF550 domain-containing protein [Salmonella enterica subsp. enterica serovar Nchanga]ECE0259105.1 DUF550 domain-containing protein [Salmonella enterica subsp. enterica]ECX1197516.1 DUF550 domain-containing protein [Salmonella enterica subsp. enterica serovar Bareilly]EDT2892471.1 DUF550 domain-containing protein [Salmonella enterica subsp. enterica serovar Litchfield]EBP1647794.1 DUF550 domain-contai